MKFRFLHCGDLHPKSLGAYAGKLLVDPSTGYSVALEDCRKSLNAILAWENDNPCDLALIGGDVFDTSKPTPAEYALISEFILGLLDRLSVVMILGNHDMNVNATSATALEPLRSLSKAHLKANTPHQLHIMTSPDRALIQTASGTVCVAGFPYPSKGRFQAAYYTESSHLEENGQPIRNELGQFSGKQFETVSPEAVMADMNQSIRLVVEGMNAGLHPTAPNIFLGHGTVSTASIGEQPRSIAHDLMIPVDAVDGYDYVALNHVHKFQQLAPNAYYSGSLLCQSFNEKDEVKGWCLVEVERDQPPVVTHIPNPHSRKFIDLHIEDLMGEKAAAAFKPLPEAMLPETATVLNRILDDLSLYNAECVYRIVGEVSEGFYPEARLAIATFEETHPFTQSAITVKAADDRMRDAGMTPLLPEEAAIERAVRTVAPEEAVAAVMEKHRVVQGVAS